MAICPECHTKDKPFWAPRCHACNSYIGFWYQLFGQLAYLLPQVLFLWFLWWLIWG